MIKNPIHIAKLGRPYGLKGWMFVHSFTEPADQLFDYQPVYLQEGKNWRAIKITDHHLHGEKLILHLEGCNTPEHAKTHTNQIISIDRSQLAETKSSQHYWADLENMQVINELGKTLGIVDHLINTGSNDILVVKGEKERMIPYLKQYILSVDLKKKIITVDWEADF